MIVAVVAVVVVVVAVVVVELLAGDELGEAGEGHLFPRVPQVQMRTQCL